MTSNFISLDIDERIQTEAAAILDESGLSLTDFLQMSLSRLTLEKRLPQGMLPVIRTQAAKKKSLGDYKASGMWADREDTENP
ncbi:hypothetical protein FACS1894216_04020 [Synergistales bacterium]|nr:hypothetical protein FACS1894216_04020 [Synergistales bacterium]